MEQVWLLGGVWGHSSLDKWGVCWSFLMPALPRDCPCLSLLACL